MNTVLFYGTRDSKVVGCMTYLHEIMPDWHNLTRWINEQGGEMRHSYLDNGRLEAVIEFENDEDAIIFKLKYDNL